MLAAYVERTDPRAPLDALVVGDRPEPEAREGWVVVDVRASSVNRHDLWSLMGVGLPDERLPMTLGCDAAESLRTARRSSSMG
jgi:NADPH:quinone reductase-like Zn-dependent oxidoreductase